MKITDEELEDSRLSELLKQPKQTERQKLAAMTARQKLSYLWTYYRLYAAAALIAACFLYAAGSMIWRGSFDTFLCCVVANNPAAERADDGPFMTDFAAFAGAGKKDVLTLENLSLAFDETATELEFANLAKITALFAARDLDVMIGDAACVDFYAEQGAFLDLEAALPAQLLSAVRDRLYYAADEEGVLRAAAVDIGGTDYSVSSCFLQEPPLFAVAVNSQRQENAILLLRYIVNGGG